MTGSAVIGSGADAAIYTARGLRCYARNYAKLSKYRLSGLVALTAGLGYAMRYEPSQQDENVPAWRDLQLYRGAGVVTMGTWLSSACANTLNQIYERRSDALMNRTRLRPLPSGRVGLAHALVFAAANGIAGLSLLSHETNSTATGLALLNIILYSGVYTPLKAISTINTPIGAIVGAIPPMLGWAAASDGELTGKRERGAWVLGATLFLWQIPHFHALAVVSRADYKAAGLRMLAVSNPVSNANWARWSAAAMIPLGYLYYVTDTTGAAFSWQFAALSYWMLKGARVLSKDPAAVKAARPLFKASIVHLPAIMGLMVANKAIYSDENDRENQRHPYRQFGDQQKQPGVETRILLQPWETMAPFPFLPVPRMYPHVVYEVKT